MTDAMEGEKAKEIVALMVKKLAEELNKNPEEGIVDNKYLEPIIANEFKVYEEKIKELRTRVADIEVEKEALRFHYMKEIGVAYVFLTVITMEVIVALVIWI